MGAGKTGNGGNEENGRLCCKEMGGLVKLFSTGLGMLKKMENSEITNIVCEEK